MSPHRSFFVRKAIHGAGLGLAGLAMACAVLWGVGLLYFAGPGGAQARTAGAILAALVGFASLGALFAPAWRRAGMLAAVIMFLALLGWWSGLRPSNERQWAPEVERLAHATVAGEMVTVHNIRNFDYRTETDFTPRYYDRTFDLRRLDSVDLVAVYWMGPAVAHLFVTFGFGDDHLAVSIEARKERGEGYSTLGGFFRQYELVYVVGDERDLIRLRTNYRKDPPEDVYLMRLKGPAGSARRLFLEYMDGINGLKSRPQFYNTLLTNCTTGIMLHASSNPDPLAYSWKVLASGYAPEYVYDSGRLIGSLPFAELFERSRVNAAAQAADAAADFSRRIRVGRPGMEPG
ncbi:MAG: DUF4105 domain-containing protein [Ramlibacter sp.]|nr:DUF4105 domain-containing protein [Ramlibacter sp.]